MTQEIGRAASLCHWWTFSIFKQPTLRRPLALFFGGRRADPPSLCSPVRGAERRKALVRIAAPRGPPCGRADLRFAEDRRPVTQAGAPFDAPLRRSCLGVGPRFRPDTAPDRQPA